MALAYFKLGDHRGGHRLPFPRGRPGRRHGQGGRGRRSVDRCRGWPSWPRLGFRRGSHRVEKRVPQTIAPPVHRPEPTRRPSAMKRDVGTELDVEITAPTTLEFQIAVAPQPGAEVHRVAVVRRWTARRSIATSGDLAVSTATASTSSTSAWATCRPTTRRRSSARPTRHRSATSTCRRICGPAATPRRTSSSVSPQPNSVSYADSADAAGEGVVVGRHPAELRARAPATRSTGRPTRCWPAPACAATTRIWWSRCCAR